jgi:hypothetical protein
MFSGEHIFFLSYNTGRQLFDPLTKFESDLLHFQEA